MAAAGPSSLQLELDASGSGMDINFSGPLSEQPSFSLSQSGTFVKEDFVINKSGIAAVNGTPVPQLGVRLGDLEMLEIVGLRAISVGFFGSVLPALLAGWVASAWGASGVGSFAIGASMATMSPPIAFNVLKAGGVLNKPIGQLVIAAATVNDLVNIIFFTQARARAAVAAAAAADTCATGARPARARTDRPGR